LFRLPYLGKRIGALVADGRFVLQSYPWMKRMTFLGLAAFVAFPLAATGAMGGSILGRLLGMTRLATFGATIIGCLIGNGVMYLASDAINRYLDKDHPVVKYGGLTLIVLIIVILEWRYRKLKQRYLEDVSH
jgi:divalent metal cation (Fe/Co/Zn/Cd) transporter